MKKIFLILILMLSVFSLQALGCVTLTGGETLNGFVNICGGAMPITSDVFIGNNAYVNMTPTTIISINSINNIFHFANTENSTLNCNDGALIGVYNVTLDEGSTGVLQNGRYNRVENCEILNNGGGIEGASLNHHNSYNNIETHDNFYYGIGQRMSYSNITNSFFNDDSGIQISGVGVYVYNNEGGLNLGNGVGKTFSGELASNTFGGVLIRRVNTNLGDVIFHDNSMIVVDMPLIEGDFDNGGLQFYNNVVQFLPLDYTGNQNTFNNNTITEFILNGNENILSNNIIELSTINGEENILLNNYFQDVLGCNECENILIDSNTFKNGIEIYGDNTNPDLIIKNNIFGRDSNNDAIAYSYLYILDGFCTQELCFVYNNSFDSDDADIIDENDYITFGVTYCFNDLVNTGNINYEGANPLGLSCPVEEETNFVNIILGIFVFLFVTGGLIMATGGFESLLFTDNIGALLNRMLIILLSAMILSKLVLVALT